MNNCKKSSIKNKRALSEVVAYVLLIVIAISLSIAVYAWIKSYLPKNVEKCPEDVSLIITDYLCNIDEDLINITFQNKGLFDIDGLLIKISNEDEKIPSFNLLMSGEESKGIVYFENNLGESLHPNEKFSGIFDYREHELIKKIQIIPFKKRSGELLLCGAASLMKDIENCN